jgi:hypothetical protein
MTIRFNPSRFRPLRFIFAALVATVLFFSNALPVLAISTTPSAPQKGEAPLDEIYQKSEDALKAEPRTQKQVRAEAQKGTNEIQGDADIDQMSTPKNSQQAVTAKEQVERALEKITGKD